MHNLDESKLTNLLYCNKIYATKYDGWSQTHFNHNFGQTFVSNMCILHKLMTHPLIITYNYFCLTTWFIQLFIWTVIPQQSYFPSLITIVFYVCFTHCFGFAKITSTVNTFICLLNHYKFKTKSHIQSSRIINENIYKAQLAT